ncbi:ABC transporter substrate-binding protein [Endozoicomonas sp. Mp262]|uniref:ABC transporter substrate-binding protein n=1 Tax=Endozoicomonas sp. Mp262 TaxID=2919499 RepID=UPI0021D9705D
MFGKRLWILLAVILLSACSGPWNDPHPSDSGDEIIYQTNFQLPPQHLDPAVSYSTDESVLIDQIYEPPLGYHFLKRPYALEPLVAEAMPEIIYLDSQFTAVEKNDPAIAYSKYIIRLKSGIRYQPHPAFVKDNGKFRYFFSTASEGAPYGEIADFEATSTRELTADDYIYQIKRLADPANRAPLIGFMAQYIVGMEAFTETLKNIERDGWLDLRRFPMRGLEKINDHTYTITIKGIYPQFSYWLAMHFFAPIPWEADRFYHNPGFKEKNLTLDWYPVGTGAFMMTRNDPNRQIVLERNPNFRQEFYPSEGTPGDREAGFLEDTGKQLPFIDKAVFTLDKEVLPMWSKFLQGYYDRSGENHGNVNQNFDQALVIGPSGIELSQEMAEKKISLSEDIKPAVFYNGFNMLDPVVGGYSEEKRKLRQAIAIAWNMEEYIEIFHNGSSLPFMGPIPPGIPGYIEGQQGINPYTHNWVNGRAERKSIDVARQLMVEAGYPGGREAETGKPLTLYFDVQSQASTKSTQDWQKRQLEKLGIQLEFRATDWNRYKEKMRSGNHQLFQLGWLGDYPDPENFLFLLHGPQSPILCQCDGNNPSNYNNPEFNQLFNQMKTMAPGSERDVIVSKMLAIVRQDSPWFTGYYPKEYYLNNQWVYNTKRHGISKATLKYLRIDKSLRKAKQKQWNQPSLIPLIASMSGFFLLLIPAVRAYRRRQRLTINT